MGNYTVKLCKAGRNYSCSDLAFKLIILFTYFPCSGHPLAISEEIKSLMRMGEILNDI